MLPGLIIGYLFYKTFWFLFLRKKEYQIEEVTEYRHIVSRQLCDFFEKPPVSTREIKEWIRLAKFSDDLYFKACPYMKNSEKMENLARRILK